MRSSSVVWVVATVLALVACGVQSDKGSGVVVMTQDLAIGADLDAVLAASPADVPALVDTMWAQQDHSSFAARAGAIAKAIAVYQPDLLGVQSAIQWRREVPASPAPANEIVSDYLDLLLAALTAAGATYDPVALVTTVDVELTAASGNDYRLIDREVILARSGVKTSSAARGTFVAHRSLSVGGVSLEYLRGWVSVSAEKDGKSYRFASTHLDSVDPAVQGSQALELRAMAAAGPPTILVGNLASDPAQPAWPAYATFISVGTGFMDAVAAAGAGFATCCRDAALVDPAARLDRRVDVVLATFSFQPAWGVRTHGNGTEMVNGLWPSAHAGVVGGLALQ